MKFTLGYHPELNDELDNLQKVYERLGVEVERYTSETHDSVFHRDVAAWTPQGIIKANMGKRSRRWEPTVWFKNAKLRRDCPRRKYALRLDGHNRFEGADLLWVTLKRAIVAWGARTSGPAAHLIKTWLEGHGAQVTLVALPMWHDQHLLGVCNAINGNVFHYGDVDNDRLDAVILPKDEYPLKGSNWVCVGNNVVINERCHKTIQLIEQYANVIPVPINKLLFHGGGVACATGVIDYAV